MVLLNKKAFAFASPALATTTMFPLVLDSAVSAVVVLLIDFEGNAHPKFDVIINAQDYNLIRPDHTDFLQDDDDDDTVVVTLVPRDIKTQLLAD